MRSDASGSGEPLRLGRYWLATRLGSGGQGVVYEAYDEAANRVAVKVLHAYLAGDHSLRRGFAKEVQAAERVPPFCTARVLGHDLEGDRPYIVSEFVSGPSLRRAVNEGRPLGPEALHRLAVGIATALTAIHGAGVVHRDLKPENVLLGPDGPRVIDFGIARAAGLTMGTTEGLVGTPTYMAPELFSGGRAEPAADVFAWAAVVLFAATGRDAFEGPTPVAVINRLLTYHPAPGALPAGLRDLVAAALSKDPAARPSAQRLLLGLLRGSGAGSALLTDGAQAAVGVRAPDNLAAEPALGAVAERVYAALPPAEREVARELLLRLVDVRDGEDVPRSATLDEIVEGRPDADTARRVLEALDRASLIRLGAGTVTLGKAALLRAWPRLHEWIRSDQESIDRHRRLGEAARRWAANGRLAEDLLRGSALHAALAWTASTRLTLNSIENEFLQHSSAGSVRQSRRRRLLAGTVAILLVGALTGGLLAWQQARRSEASDRRLAVSDRRLVEQRAQAAARRVALQADALRDSDPVKAMLLSVAAYRIAPVPEARAAVFSALAQQEQRVFKDPALANEGRALSVDGRILVSAGADKVTAYDVSTGKKVRTFTGVGQGPFSVALSPDGDTLALGRNGIHLWSLRTGKQLGEGTAVPRSSGPDKGDPSEMRFSPGGGYIRLFQNRGGPYFALWNVAKRRLEIPPETLPESEILELSSATLGPHDDFGAVATYTGGEHAVVVLRALPEGGPVRGKRLPGHLSGRILAFSPDGAHVLIADDEKTRLWSLTEGDWGREFYAPSEDAVFSADGTLLVTSGTTQQGTTVALWRVKDGVQLLNLTIDAAIVGPPRISPDNRTLTLLDETGQVTAYDISRCIRQPDVPAADADNRREFNATGDALFALAGGVLHRWSLPGLTETSLKIKPGRNDEFDELGMAVSPDGRTLATSVLNNSTPKLTLWDIETGRKLRDVTLKEENPEKRELRFSPDGRFLAISYGRPNDYTGQGQVEIVDVRHRKQVMRFRQVAGGSMSLSADGKTLVTADEGGVDVIDLAKKKLLPRSKGPGTLAKGWMVLAPKGGLAAAPYGGRAVALWNTHTWKPIGQVLRLPGSALGGRFSPDGRFLAVTHDTRVTLFDVAGGYQLGTPQVVTVAESAADNALSPVMAFSADSSVLYVLGGDGTLHELPVDPERVVPEVCRRAGRPLRPAEWQEHVGGEVPYVKTC
ncbi:protein kinase domain-containing protein [Microbispora sp. CA-102843]|uniref:protein kinase domain-containing protein n=1 Tax=Microbispora sp. CA-102843 TaxID=3239952 RepID=UPI003D8F29F0